MIVYMNTTSHKSICILSTGGTISMQKTANGYAPAVGYLESAMTRIPELQNPDMPDYVIHEFDKPIDSANMTPANWQQIGEYIYENYSKYDGFVVLHGTDTMAYTASALSFMLENLSKPVILTGSQLPLFETRSDARENLINALWIAGNYIIPEICIYFQNKLLRGNRSTKMDASSFSAFVSPNFPTLGKVGTDVRVRKDLLLKVTGNDLRLQLPEPIIVSVLRIFPGMSADMIKSLLASPLQALVLQTYGVGNAPNDPQFLNELKAAINNGMVIVNCSQCVYAKVHMSDYSVGSALLDVGVVSCADMTVEASLAKLFYLFSKNIDISEIRKQMMLNLRGELTL